MQWLIANMWMALAAATVLGLLFGFSFRGLFVGSRIRKAQVEREIAKTELSQAKAEVEALYAAQRKRKEESAQAVGADETLQTELAERETRIVSLGDELDAARAELEQLKTSASDTDGADPTLVAAAPDSEELTELRDRNTWLEERVSSLETEISAAPVAAGVAEPSAEEGDVGREKLNWQNAYLRQRVDALETKVIETAAVPAVADAAPIEAAAETSETPPAEADEELARLRWRNRYLEGRLAYFEESEEGGVEAEDLAEEAPSEASEEDAAPTVAAVAPAPEPEPEPASEDVHPSEAMLAELEGVRPEQIEGPKDGGDDLTAISGIGPRIAEVLNEQGIWTYAQISSWTPENATWIENHLSFKGRVSRENWIAQAQELMA